MSAAQVSRAAYSSTPHSHKIVSQSVRLDLRLDVSNHRRRGQARGQIEKHIHAQHQHTYTHIVEHRRSSQDDRRPIMTFAFLLLVGVGQRAAYGQWVTGGYAASQVTAYISGSGTTMFNGVSSSAPSYSAPAPAPATCDARGVSRCEDVSLYDSDGQCTASWKDRGASTWPSKRARRAPSRCGGRAST